MDCWEQAEKIIKVKITAKAIQWREYFFGDSFVVLSSQDDVK
jgi:hypothetical protein